VVNVKVDGGSTVSLPYVSYALRIVAVLNFILQRVERLKSNIEGLRLSPLSRLV